MVPWAQTVGSSPQGKTQTRVPPGAVGQLKPEAQMAWPGPQLAHSPTTLMQAEAPKAPVSSQRSLLSQTSGLSRQARTQTRPVDDVLQVRPASHWPMPSPQRSISPTRSRQADSA